MNLEDWLTHCERLHPQTIDMGLDRIQAVARRLALTFDCPVITVAGTNGKGSTCAMLESVLRHAGFQTGLYTSPHLVHFEERCRFNGQPATSLDLISHFEKVEAARGDVSLSFFEFTSLAIFSLLASAKLDVVILEVGLGGRLDAVNIINSDCAVITSIDLDHQALLGDNREAIGLEKAGIMRAQQPVVVCDPSPPESLLAHARSLKADVWRVGLDFQFSGDTQQWTWRGRVRTYSGLAYPALRGANQLLNAAGVLAVLEVMRPRLPVTAQAIRLGLSLVQWPGRFQILTGQPSMVLDVAHNPHAVAALAHNLDAMGYYPRTHAVMGAMADKDLAGMIKRLMPLVDHWYFCDLPTPRAASAAELNLVWHAQHPAATTSADSSSSPSAALALAMSRADPTDRIIVFGSFFTVGGVLEEGIPGRLTANLQS
ncbi:MAG: bifunctional tetrahydrofolate synthase/dihydrofolate synthase [Betaproteobacteria bacterium]|nr:bifunctional tetrahydrofolate synthase/dihydrofolate synthase [Betaproteobacteria bacterium]